MATVDEFKREYTRALSEGYAAIFAGAGLSYSAGYVNWKSLVSPFADDIGLSIDKETDLILLTQFYKNERGNRAAINQKIINEFTKNTEKNENIDIVTRLPISTYWTTNYDSLIEDGLKNNNRKPDIKISQESLAHNIYDRDAVVYHMHGSVSCPETAVITKDDYERYSHSRPLFRSTLQGDLISKTFLFIGFSFDDPNLNHILGQIKVLLDESVRDHYCFFERIKMGLNESEKDFHYREIKQNLRIKDLRRYGIQAIELDSYSEITNILKRLEYNYLLKSIFISGAYSEAIAPWTTDIINKFAYNLARVLVQKNYKIVSGFGLGIGSSIINGALDEIMKSKYKHVDEHLCLRPFPQNISDTEKRKYLFTTYRQDMISQCGISIFMFGNKFKDDKLINSNGMIEEFELAKKQGKIIIPLPTTGGASQEIFNMICSDISNYKYLEPFLDKLSLSNDPEELINIICAIIDSQQVI